MPQNKDALTRYRVIFDALKSGDHVKSSRLAHLCEIRLGVKVTPRAIQLDLKNLREDTKLQAYWKIGYDNSQKAYYFEEVPNNLFTILLLDEQEIAALLFYVKAVNQYRDYPLFQDIMGAVGKVIESSNVPPSMREQLLDTSHLQPERHRPIQGISHIPDLLRALLLRRVIEVSYRTFKRGRAKAYRIRPVLLREDRQFWYVLGFPVSDDQVITIALDRIHSLNVTDEVFDQISFSPEEHFRHAMGITVESGLEAVEVVLSFEAYQGNYLRTIPFHTSQQILVDAEDEFRISVRVQPTFEFFTKVLGYADRVRVLSPAHIAEDVRNRLSAALTAYTA